jgi:drug/metabolite transporter (DMT)-like permease
LNTSGSLTTNLSRNQRGALWMLGSAMTFVAMATLVKYLGDDYPASLQLFYRQLAGCLVILPMILRSTTPVFRSPRPWLVIARSFASVSGITLMFYSYQHLPLADANALSFTRVLWVVLLAALLLGERLDAKRIAATLTGFCGVLLIVNPTGHQPNLASLAALLSALLLGWSVTGIKSLTSDHSTITIVSLAGVLGLFLSFPLALLVWRWPTAFDLLLLASMGAFGVINQTCYVKAMSLGDAGVMASMDYIRLIFAVFSGWLFFGDLPSLRTLLGAAIIIGSTLYITSVQEEKKSVKKSATGGGVISPDPPAR